MTPSRTPIMNEATQETGTIMAVTVAVPIPWIALELPMSDEKQFSDKGIMFNISWQATLFIL